METKMLIDFNKAQVIADEYIKANPGLFDVKYLELQVGKLEPNKSIDNPSYWEFWFVQEDSKLLDIEYVRSIGIDLAKVLTFAGQSPSVLISKVRVSKESGAIDLISASDAKKTGNLKRNEPKANLSRSLK